MNLRIIKDTISLLEKSGVSENAPVDVTVEENTGNKEKWTLSFNIAEFLNEKPSKIEIRIRKDSSNYEN